MSKRGRRRSGGDLYQSPRRSLPRPLILDLLDAVYSRSTYKRPIQSTTQGYGGLAPHAKRSPARSLAHPWALPSAYVPRTQSKLIYSAPSRSPRGHIPLLKAHLLRPHIVGTSIPTMPGDRKTEPVKRPDRVDQCTQRKDRKEVLHALGIAGRRGSAPGRRGSYHRNLMSNFSCKG